MTHARACHITTGGIMLDHSTTLAHIGRRLDALAVEKALHGRRPYRDLPAPEAAEVLRILARRGDRLDQIAALLNTDPHEITHAYTDAGRRR